MAQLAQVATVSAMERIQHPPQPTFRKLCSIAWGHSPARRPRFSDLPDAEKWQLAGAWMRENPQFAVDCFANTSHTDTFVENICAWLQAPTTNTQAALLATLRRSVVEHVEEAIADEFERIEMEVKLYG